MIERAVGYDVTFLPSQALLEITTELKRLSQEDYEILEEYWSGYELLAKKAIEGSFDQHTLEEYGYRMRKDISPFEFATIVSQAKYVADELIRNSKEDEALEYLKGEFQKIITCSKS